MQLNILKNKFSNKPVILTIKFNRIVILCGKPTIKKVVNSVELV